MPENDLKYLPADKEWGLNAFYEGYRLDFSASADRRRLLKETLRGWLPARARKEIPDLQSTLKSVDIYMLFSPSAKLVWKRACHTALKYHHPLSLEDVFLALLKKSVSVQKLFAKIKVNTADAEKFLKNYLQLTNRPESAHIQKLPFEAFALAMKIHNRKIGGLMLLGGLLRLAPKDNVLQAIFSNMGLTLEKLEVLAVWILNLEFDFPKNSSQEQILYCCRQAGILEEHFGYFYEFPAVEAAVAQAKSYYPDLRGQKALQYLVKAGQLAKTKGNKTISQKFVELAAN